MNAFTTDVLREALEASSVLRIRLKLEPAGAGGLVYPPTYDQGQHIFRSAWADGEEHEIVLLDSPQSQANRIELAVLDAHQRGDIAYPNIEISVPSPIGNETYSVLELSHRTYDAALLLTEDAEGIPFSQTAVGQAIGAARLERATGLYTHAPMTLALGGWDSHSGGGPLSAKIPRAVTSEIIGVDAKKAMRGATKFDPMDIRRSAGPVFKSGDRLRVLELDKKKADPSDKKEKRPSELGLGSVPNLEERGAYIRYALQNSIISLSAVRRLRFETVEDKFERNRDTAGQVAVVALSLYGLLRQMESGYFLRSGCDLIPMEEPVIEVVGRTLAETTAYGITADTCHEVLSEALDGAGKQDLKWRDSTLLLRADDRLTKLVERSRLTTQVEQE